MKVNIIIFALLVFPVITAYGQLDVNAPDDSSVTTPPTCHQMTLSGERAYTPFFFKMFFPSTQNATMDVVIFGEGKPLRQQINNAMSFYTNDTGNYRIHVNIPYHDSRPRAVNIVTQTELSQIVNTEIVPFSTQTYCLDLSLTTSNAPHIKTLQEELGQKGWEILQETPLVKDAINRNTNATNNAFSLMAIIIMSLVVFVIIVVGFIAFEVHSGRITSTRLLKVVRLYNLMTTKLQKNLNENDLKVDMMVKEIRDRLSSQENMTMITLNAMIVEAKKLFKDFPIDEIVIETKELPPDDIKVEDKVEQSILDRFKTLPAKTLRNMIGRMGGRKDKLSVIRAKIAEKVLREKLNEDIISEDNIKSLDKMPDVSVLQVEKEIEKTVIVPQKDIEQIETVLKGDTISNEETTKSRPPDRTLDEYLKIYSDSIIALRTEYSEMLEWSKSYPTDTKARDSLLLMHSILQGEGDV